MSKEHCRRSAPKRRDAHRAYDKSRYSTLKSERKVYDRRVLLKKNFNMTQEDYDKLLTIQDKKCAICLATDPKNKRYKYSPVDHDHATNKIRGLLCSPCNLLLGNANDDVTVLTRAIAYLTKHRTIP